MKQKKKFGAIAKDVGIWWGIYLILGCCAGFAVKTMQDLFLEEEKFRLTVYLPLLCAGSFLLAVMTYIISSAVKSMPKKKLRKKLRETFLEEGFSAGWFALLSENAKGDMKIPAAVAAAGAYCLRGDTEKAEKALEGTDPEKISGDAKRACYYCVKMAVSIISRDGGGAAKAYEEGEKYLNLFPDSDIVMAVLALYQTEGGLYEPAIGTVEKIGWKSLSPAVRKYGTSFCEAIRAKNLLALGKFPEAESAAAAALENPCSDYMRAFADELLDSARAAKERVADFYEAAEASGTEAPEEPAKDNAAEDSFS